MRTFTALEILNRAAEYGIVVGAGDNNLTLNVPPTLASDKRDKAIAVIKANDAAILDFLSKLEQHPSLCFTCLNLGKETLAPLAYEDLMYCHDHWPCRPKRKGETASQCAACGLFFSTASAYDHHRMYTICSLLSVD